MVECKKDFKKNEQVWWDLTVDITTFYDVSLTTNIHEPIYLHTEMVGGAKRMPNCRECVGVIKYKVIYILEH